MTVRIACYESVFLDSHGRATPRGSMKVPTERSIAGTTNNPRRITLAAGAKLIVWDYARDGYTFELMRVKVVSDGGYIRGALKIDTPNSGTDLAPSGGAVRARHFEVGCLAAHFRDTDEALAGSTAALDAGWAGAYPDLWTDAGRADGRVYTVALWNPGAEAATVEIDFFD